MYQPNEPIRGKYLVRMEAKIAEEIVAREARRNSNGDLHTRVHRSSGSLMKRLQEGAFSFFSRKTDRSVFYENIHEDSSETSNEIVAMQPNFLG